MKDFGLAITGPTCLLVFFCGLAVMLGADAWGMLSVATIGLPIAGYVVFSIFTVISAVKIGEVGAHQNMTFQMRFYFWHGVAVVLTIVLAAAGSFVLLFASGVRGLISGAA